MFSSLNQRFVAFSLLFCGVGLSAPAQADFFHFNNFIIGDRAVGMGGAYTAVADDASAMVYNPAGMAFAQSSSFSGSASVRYVRNITYKDTIGEDDFVERSAGLVPSFFGSLQQIPALGNGAAWGFAIYSPDGDSKSQDDRIVKPDQGVTNFHRAIITQASTDYYGAGLAMRLNSRLALGAGANILSISELTQDYQDTTNPVNSADLVLTTEAQAKGQLFQDSVQNRRFEYDILAVEPIFGLQYAPFDSFVVGLTYRHPIILNQSLKIVLDDSTQLRFGNYTPLSSSDIAAESTGVWASFRENGVSNAKRTPTSASPGLAKGEFEVEEPFGGWPSELRLGMAWFASSRFLMTSDFSYRIAPAVGDVAILEMNDTWNASAGIEYYVIPSLPLRLGLFTNNDARPEIESGKAGQADHIDFYGATLMAAWASGGVQIGAAGVGQYGIGKAQKLGNSAVQEVEADFYSFVISTAYTL